MGVSGGNIRSQKHKTSVFYSKLSPPDVSITAAPEDFGRHTGERPHGTEAQCSYWI